MITHERLKELLAYDPMWGCFRWLVDKSRSRKGSIAGNMRRDGYWRVKLDQREYLSHRLAWFYVTKKWPSEIDHINGNPADFRFENLRECSRSQNFANRAHKIGKKTPKGVRQERNRFAARIVVNKKEIRLGSFATVADAQRAYMFAARKIYGEFASNGDVVIAPRERS